MMNQQKSHTLHHWKFILFLPIVFILLLSFRNIPIIQHIQDSLNLNSKMLSKQNVLPPVAIQLRDTTPNNKSKSILINGKNERNVQWSWSSDQDDKIKNITINGNSKEDDKATVTLKNGSKENYNLTDDKMRAEFLEKYGDFIPPPPPPPPIPNLSEGFVAPPSPPMKPEINKSPLPPPPSPPVGILAPMPPPPPPIANYLNDVDIPDAVTQFAIHNDQITIKLKDGSSETYNMSEAEDKAKFKERMKTLKDKE